MHARLTAFRAIALLFTFVCLPLGSHADTLELGRSSFSGGGGESSGGNLSTRSTTSQPDAGAASGGDFSLSGSIASGDPTLCFSLAAATGFFATDALCGGIHLGWLDNTTHETGYRILRDGNELVVTGPDASTYDDVSAVAGTTYTYAVVATNGCSDSFASDNDPGRRSVAPVKPTEVEVIDYQVDESGVTVQLRWQEHSVEEATQTIYQTLPSMTAIQTLGPNVESTTFTLPITGPGSLCFAVGSANCEVVAVSDPVCIASVSVDHAAPLPKVLALRGIAPNPFGSQALVGFDLPHDAWVSLKVFDVAGRLVETLADREYPAGRHVLAWTGRDASGASHPNGVYFVEFRASGYRAMRRVTLMR